MTGGAVIGQRVMDWAQSESSLSGLALIGSRLTDRADAIQADENSDWDFQAICRSTTCFADARWMAAAGLPAPLVYVSGQARLGGVPKVYAVLPETELEIVLLSHAQATLVKLALRLGVHRRSARFRRLLRPLVASNHSGFKFVKGAARWDTMFRRMVAEIAPPRLSDAEVRSMADEFFINYVTVRRRLDRGEYHSAQRLLHLYLLEINQQFLHEAQLRVGQFSLPDARRLSSLNEPTEVAAVSVKSAPEGPMLHEAVEHSTRTCRKLVKRLVGADWQWPRRP